MRHLAHLPALLFLAGCGSGWSPPELPDGAPVDARVRAAVEEAAASGDVAELAMLLDANGFPGLAAPCYERCAADEPAGARWWYHLGRVREELGETASALAAFRRARDLEPGFPPARRRLGRLLLDSGERAAGEAELRVAADRGDPVARALVRGLDGAPPEATGRDEELASDPWLREVRARQGGPRARLARARAVLDSEGPAAALPLLEELRRERPDDVGVLGAHVAALLALDRTDEALATALAAREADPTDARRALVLGETLAAGGDPDAARARFEEAVRLQPHLAVAHARLGMLLLETGDPDAALGSLAEAMRLGLAETELLLRLGVLQRTRGHEHDAVETFERVVALDARSHAGWLFLARARGEVGLLPEARAALERARALGPDRPDLAAVEARLSALEGDG